MILSSPGSVLFDLGVIKIYYYGLIMAISVLIGLFVCKIVAQKIYGEEKFDMIYDLAIGTIISGFVGARLYYVSVSYKYFLNHVNEIFMIQNGGMSIHGAIIGGILFAFVYLKIKKMNILKYFDILSFGLISGQIIGRWGNFFNSEAFGLPSNLFLKLYIPIERRPIEFITNDYFHPTFLYESLLNCLVLLILLFIDKKSKRYGVVFFSYILLYSVVRFFIESLRIDSALNIFNIPIAQIISIIGIISGIFGLLIIKIQNKSCMKL